MDWILDLIVIGIIVYFAIVSAKHGFVRTVVELAGFVVIFLFITRFGTPVSEKIFDVTLRDSVVTKLETSLQSSADTSMQKISDALPQYIKNCAGFLGISTEPEVLNIDDVRAIAEKLTDNVVRPVITSLIYGIISLILFAFGMYIVRILARAVNSLFKISFIGTINKLLGAVLGAGKGIVVAFFVCIAITVIISFTENGFWIFNKESIENTYIFSKLAHFNPLYK